MCLQKTHLHMGQELADGKGEPQTAGGCGETKHEDLPHYRDYPRDEDMQGRGKVRGGWGQ